MRSLVKSLRARYKAAPDRESVELFHAFQRGIHGMASLMARLTADEDYNEGVGEAQRDAEYASEMRLWRAVGRAEDLALGDLEGVVGIADWLMSQGEHLDERWEGNWDPDMLMARIREKIYDLRAAPAQPFRRWRDNTPENIAFRIVSESRWEDVPILADALEEAGCTDDRLLTALRTQPIPVDWMPVVYRIAGTGDPNPNED